MLAYRVDHDARTVIQGKPANTGSECREGNGLETARAGERQRVSGRHADEATRRCKVLTHDGRMDHRASGQTSGAGLDAFTRLDGALGNSFGFNLAPASSLDCARDTSTHPEVVVRSIDDGVGRLGGDVAFGDL